MTGLYLYNTVGIGITERCNLSCPHCYTSAKKTARNELTTDELKGVIDVLSNVGTGKIGWTGGEPLIRKDIEELIAYARARGNIISSITTNGIPLTSKRVDSLRESGLHSIQISVDGSTAEKNRQIRSARLADFDLIMKGVKYCTNSGIPVTLAMIAGRQTMDDIRNYIEMAKDLGVESIRFCGFIPHGLAVQDEIQKRLAFGDRIHELAVLVEELAGMESPNITFDAGFGPTPPTYDFHECHAGLDLIYIDSVGNVYPCTCLLEDRFLVGNIRKRPLKEILNDPAMRQIAEYDRSQVKEPCRSCQYFRVCRGACRGATFAHTGDLNASFPVCLFQALHAQR